MKFLHLCACAALLAGTLLANNPIHHINREIKRGNLDITVSSGTYRLKPDDPEKPYLTLQNLQDLTLDFTDVEFIGTVRTRMIYLKNCRNVTIKGLTIDYDPLPFTQAVITKVDKDRSWDVKILPGYPSENINLQDVWPIQAYDAKTRELVNPMRMGDKVAITKTGPGTYRITGGQNRNGKVGDIAVWSVREPGTHTVPDAISQDDCRNNTCQDITVYSTPHGRGFSEFRGHGNTYRHCRLIRRLHEPAECGRTFPRLRSGNHDAFMSRLASKGPRLISCTAQYHADDCVNISGMYSFVTHSQGNQLRIAVNWAGFNFMPGDTVQLMTFQGESLPEATVLDTQSDGEVTPQEQKAFQTYGLWPGLAASCKQAYRLTMNRELNLPPGTCIISNQACGNDFIIKDCTFGHSRSRGLLIKASHGLIEGNVILDTWGPAMQISPEFQWMEGGCSGHLVVRNNRLNSLNTFPIQVAGTCGTQKPLPCTAHRNIAIMGNSIEAPAYGIQVIGCTGLSILGNRISLQEKKLPIHTLNVKNASIRRNQVTIQPKP